MKESTALKRIKCLCLAKKLDCNEIYHKAEVLLSIYRDVIWQTLEQVDDLYDNISEINSDYLSDDLDSAFTYLANFASSIEQDSFETKLISLTKTKWVIDIIDKAMIRVYNYYGNGPLYHEILSKTYLIKIPYSEDELLEMLDLERSNYYRKKKEAIFLFGISLWGYEISELKTLI